MEDVKALGEDLERMEALNDACTMYLAGVYPLKELIITVNLLIDSEEEKQKLFKNLGIEL